MADWSLEERLVLLLWLIEARLTFVRCDVLL